MDLIARELYDFYGSTDSWEIYNDAVAFLKALKESHPGVKTGMITNFDRRILSLLEQFGISDLIDVKVNTKSTYLQKAFFSAPRKTSHLGISRRFCRLFLDISKKTQGQKNEKLRHITQ